MNTPSHAIVNLGVLGRRYPAWPVLTGAILPDIPVYLLYLGDKFQAGASEARIWSVDYFNSSWQPVIDALHSFPLILIAFGLARYLKAARWEAFSASLFFHSLGDIPFHHEDAHRHFFPFGDYRFRSPVSYWDPRHHGALGAGIELFLVLAAAVELCRRSPSRPALWALGSLGLFYASAYFMLYLRG